MTVDALDKPKERISQIAVFLASHILNFVTDGLNGIVKNRVRHRFQLIRKSPRGSCLVGLGDADRL